MESLLIAFLVGFLAGCSVCIVYIGSLKAKIASYRLYFARRLDDQINDFRNRLGPDEGSSDGGPRTPPRRPSPTAGGVTAEGLKKLSSLVSPSPLNPQKPVSQHD
jgi:hypothetical protein